MQLRKTHSFIILLFILRLRVHLSFLLFFFPSLYTCTLLGKIGSPFMLRHQPSTRDWGAAVGEGNTISSNIVIAWLELLPISFNQLSAAVV